MRHDHIKTQDSEGDIVVGCQRMMGEMLGTPKMGKRCFSHSLSHS